MAFRECIILHNSNKIKKMSLLKGGDFFLMIFIIMLPFVGFRSKKSEDFSLVISHFNNCVATVSPFVDTVMEINGVDILINSGEATVISSVCPSQICVHSSSISRVGQSIICVPNGVVVKAVGTGGVDAVAQ